MSRRRFRTTVKDGEARPAADLVERNFVAEATDRLWVADITHVPTATLTLYMAVIVDACGRRIVGWGMATDLRTSLVLAALAMAVERRQPRGVIHHSDQESRYTSLAFGHHCRRSGIRPSTSSVGDRYDDAMAESFFATLECELPDRTASPDPMVARHEILPVHRGLAQRPPAALRAGLPVAGRLRGAVPGASVSPEGSLRWRRAWSLSEIPCVRIP